MGNKYNSFGRDSYGLTNDSIASGRTFLTKELEKFDEKLLEPLTSVTWQRDMPVRTGAGFVENIADIAVQYTSAGAGVNGIIGAQTNNIPVVDADFRKGTYKVLQWANTLRISYIDQQKLQTAGRNLEDILNKGVKLTYNKTLDENIYTGFADFGTTGLVNNAGITSYTAADNSNQQNPSSLWEDKTPDEMLADINEAMLYTWAASEYDISGMANHFLIPPTHYAKLVHTKVGVTGDKSILTFLYENNLGRDQGVDIKIYPSRWVVGAGAAQSDRMVCYANNEDRVRFDLAVPIRRWHTEIADLAYKTPYLSLFSEVQFMYTQPVVYVDGI